jgi:hypothetical protein
MNERLMSRWFHTLVVTGASLTACGGETTGVSFVAPREAGASIDATSSDERPKNASDERADAEEQEAGTTEDASPTDDAPNDFRCCIITAP